jgi:scavenger receptor class B, member 1
LGIQIIHTQVLEGAKPVLQQVGPYVFTEKHHKSDLQWNKNGTVTYKQIRTWNFLPEETVGSLDDEASGLIN